MSCHSTKKYESLFLKSIWLKNYTDESDRIDCVQVWKTDDDDDDEEIDHRVIFGRGRKREMKIE